MNIERDPFGREYRAGRLSDEQTARRMIETAIAKVNEDGLPVSFDALRFEDVIAQAGVARSAVYRRWPTKQHFYADLLLALAGFEHPVQAAYDRKTVEVSIQGTMENLDQLRSPAGRRALLVELMRVGALQNFDSLTTARSWSVYVTLLATLDSLPDNDFRADLQTALRESERNFVSRMAQFYEVMMHVLGYRVRPELQEVTTRTIAQLGAAVVEGLTLNNSADPEVGLRRFVLDPFGVGTLADWSLPGIGFASVALALVEPDPQLDGEWSDDDVARRVEMLQEIQSSR